MRVLQLPVNVATQISDTIQALRDIGVEARGLASPGVITSNDAIELLSPRNSRHPLRYLQAMCQRTRMILQAIEWADVVHWYCGRGLDLGVDIAFARHHRKKMIVEYEGADIRIAAQEAADNPYYAEVQQAGLWEYRKESLVNSRRHQRIFSRYGAHVLIPCPSLLPHVQRDLFPEIHTTRQRIYLSKFTPTYPDPGETRPLLIHSPSKLHAKGTPAVLDAVDTLKASHEFEFTLVHGVPYDEARRIMQRCDVFIDQLVLGSHGVAALEAMACGKPVICYIKPSMVPQYPDDMPIVSATKETLPAVLSDLINNPERRHELGKQGRAYVEKYHDAHQLARELVLLYERL